MEQNPYIHRRPVEADEALSVRRFARTEEFYYKDGNLVFALLEENGLGKENHDANAKGDKYYFQDRKLIAAIGADGQPMNVNGSEAKRMEEKILKESRAFRAAAKDKTLAQERH